jgi:ATP-dependent helicase/nuclease subunit A
MPFLESDLSVRLPLVSVIKASAGSGKTYTLTERYVQFALSREISRNDLRNILAITFSNNASREMKENVLGWLKRLYFGDPGRTADMTAITTGGERFIRRRAGELIEEILSRYSDFQVRTIDSFMSTVFRASALDFGFSPEFEILMEAGPLTDYAFGLYLREAREGSERAALLDGTIESVLGFHGEGERFPWDPVPPLLEKVKRIDERLGMLEGDVSRVDLSPRMRKAESDIRESLERLAEMVESSGLERTLKSTFPAALASARAGRFRELISKGMKLSPVKKPSTREGRERYQEIAAAWNEVDSLVSLYAALWARSFYLPYLGLHSALDSTMERVKKNQGKLFIADISRWLGKYLAEEIVPDIYFRLGERIFHFLIDEFQDTSPIQWKNLFPLIENSLAEGGSLFVVGDTKQAIYGFRQADYTIMKALERGNPFPSARHAVRELSENWRSRPRILEYVAEVFKRNVPAAEDCRSAAEASGLSDWTQTARSGKDPGYVETEILARDDDDPPERIKLQSVMAELRARGYRWGDIAVLAPKNDDVVRAASWLNEKGIPFLSFSSLDVRRRGMASEILSLLAFLDSPPDDLAFASFILGELFGRCLRRHGWESSDPLHRLIFRTREKTPLYKVFQDEHPDLWKTYFSGLFRSAGYLPLYDLASEVFSVFGMFELAAEEQATLAKLLEAVKDFEGSGSNSLRDFLSEAAASASEEAAWNIDIPRGADCVSVMTVHKAKGLGFPVVVVILYGERSKGFEYTVVRENDNLELVKLSREIAARDPDLESVYRRESEKEKVNYLNALYVALTRAKSELYVVGVKREADSHPFDLLPVSGYPPLAEKGPVRSEAAPAEGGASLAHETRPVRPSPGRARLALEERERGELVHRMLSLIPYAEAGLDAALSTAARRASREARAAGMDPAVVDTVSRTLRDPRLSAYFGRSPGRIVLTEQEFCDKDGRLVRMDRLVVDPDRVTVLDFKTGGEEKEDAAHEEQIQAYAAILSEAYPGRRIEALLVYTDRSAVRRVL